MFPLFFFFTFTLFPTLLFALPNPDPATIQTFLPSPSPPATIPAFPEQSDVAGCPLDLPDDLFRGVQSACAVTTKGNTPIPDNLRRTRCCPVLAAWLYSAYSATALGRAVRSPQTASYDLPLLPDDSETCVDTLQKALNARGIDLVRPNETCDVVYCYCGIRLHPMSCTEAFSVSSEGELVARKGVKRLERDCLSKSAVNGGGGGYGGLGGCSKCLNSLHLIKGNSSNTSKLEDRTSKMHNKDCELMGLTWLLAKNRSAYIHTVSAVLRAMMMSTDGSSGLKSCTLNSDGMPLAVDSSEMGVSPNTLQPPLLLSIFSLCLLYASLSSTFLHSLLHVA